MREVDNVDLDSPLQEELAKMYIPGLLSEKFTELIVRECACIADDMKQIDTAKAIKQHFGVEE
jgi:hypothetical protein